MPKSASHGARVGKRYTLTPSFAFSFPKILENAKITPEELESLMLQLKMAVDSRDFVLQDLDAKVRAMENCPILDEEGENPYRFKIQEVRAKREEIIYRAEHLKSIYTKLDYILNTESKK